MLIPSKELVFAISTVSLDGKQERFEVNSPVISTTIDKETRCAVNAFSNTKVEIPLDASSVNFQHHLAN